MAVREILHYQEADVLRKKSREVEKIDDRVIQLLDDMAETMYESNGAGLAAPQVGILKRVVVIDIGEGLIELINPVILRESGSQTGEEGCLSIPNYSAEITRPMRAKVRALNRNGEEITLKGEGLLARAFCHEVDHLNGVLFIDRLKK